MQPASTRELPPVPPLPVWAQTLALRHWPIRYLGWCRSRYGPRFTVRVLDLPPLVFLTDASEIEAVLTAPTGTLRPGAGTELIAPLIGERSFILSDDDDYRRALRKAIAPFVRKRAGEDNRALIEAVTRQELAGWPCDRTIALYPRLSRVTLRVILTLLLGGDAEVRRLEPQLLAMLDFARSPVVQVPRLRQLPGWRSSWRRFQLQRLRVTNALSEVIARQATQPKEACPVHALLDVRRDGATLSSGEVADNLLSLIVAGHETTASTLAWAFLLLAQNPAVQQRLLDEIDRGEGTQYLDATVLEALRCGPVFLFAIPRAVVERVQAGVHSYSPPAQLLACTYLLQNDPAHYPEPHAFRPERFLDGAPSRLVWKPWGGGRRRCLGQHLAELEIRTVLRTVLAHHRVVAARSRIERAAWRSAILAPRSGAYVVLEARDGQAGGPRRLPKAGCTRPRRDDRRPETPPGIHI